MAEYLIQDTTMTEMANQMRKISGTTDSLSGAEIAEMFSRTQGTVKTDGAYNVKAIKIGNTIKSGTYDTGEIFALPKNTSDFMDFITQPDGTQKATTIATFDGWTGTSPIGRGYVKVDDMPIDIGALYKPVDDDFIIHIETTEVGTTIKLNVFIKSGGEIDWGDGVIEIRPSNSYEHSFTHTYTNIGNYLIRISKDSFINNALINSNFHDLGSVVKGICIPSYAELVYSIQNLKNLEYVIIADGATVASHGSPDFWFYKCDNLKYIALPKSFSLIDDMFSQARVGETGGGIESIVLPYGIISIPNSCFSDCINLKDIILPKSVTSIGSYAFSGCTSLESITLPKSVTSISDYMFCDCDSLAEVKGLDNVTSIGAKAFTFESIHGANTGLTLILPSVTSIGSQAFYHGRNHNAGGVTLVLGTDVVCSIESDTFNEAFYNLEVYVPDSLIDAYKADTNWSVFASKIKPLSEYTGTI